VAAAGLAGVYLATFAAPSTLPLPEKLPSIARFRPARRYFPSTAKAGDPGSEVRALHARGITGRGVGVAVLDTFLLASHTDFAGRLRWYDEIDAAPGEAALWHGTATASIAAGRKYGVAPEADLYFVGLGANWRGQPVGDWLLAARRLFTARRRVATGIRRVLAVNRTLPAGRRIRVISMSMGLGQPLFGDAETRAAIAEAEREGIFVATLDLGLPRLGPVVAASPEGPDAYTEYTTPAGSWAIAHCAGRYALAAQEDASMTPRRFLAELRARERVSFPTADGGLIYADVYGKGGRGVVLAHGAKFDKESWAPQARELADAGFRALAIDFRGYGESRGPGQADIYTAPLYQDVLAGVRYLRRVGAGTVSVIGASIGGAAAARAVAEARPGEIDALVLLAGAPDVSPAKLTCRKLFIVARDDRSGTGLRLPGIRAAYEEAPEPKKLLVVDGSAHAQALFRTDQGARVMREIVRFLSR
jgi:subtilisin family serine protease